MGSTLHALKKQIKIRGLKTKWKRKKEIKGCKPFFNNKCGHESPSSCVLRRKYFKASWP